MASTPHWYMFPRCDTNGFDKLLVVLWNMVNILNKDINVYGVTTSVIIPHVKSSSECSRSRHKRMVYSDTDGAIMSTGDRV